MRRLNSLLMIAVANTIVVISHTRLPQVSKLVILLLLIAIGSNARGNIITLQPGSGLGKDTYVTHGGDGTEYRADRNFGAATDLDFGYWGSTGEWGRRSLIEFDNLPTLSAGQSVISARLGLTALSGDTNTTTLAVYRMLQPWVAGTRADEVSSPNGATWQTFDSVNAWPGISGYRTNDGGGFNALSAVISTPLGTGNFSVSAQLNWISLDAMTVQGWVTGALPNNGMLIRSLSEYTPWSAFEVASSDYPVPSYRPILEITTTSVPEPASFTLFGVGTIGLIACVWRKRRVA